MTTLKVYKHGLDTNHENDMILILLDTTNSNIK